MRLKPLTPQTEEEKIEYSIAAERRRMRLVHKDTLKDLLTHSPQETGTLQPDCQNTPLVTSHFLSRRLVVITTWRFGNSLAMAG